MEKIIKMSLDEYLKLKEFHDKTFENQFVVYYWSDYTGMNSYYYLTNNEAIEELIRHNATLADELNKIKAERINKKQKTKQNWFYKLFKY